MEEITLTKENFNISRDEVTNEITATLINIPKDNSLNLSIISLFGVQKLFINSFSNIIYIKIRNINDKPTIILDNLSNIESVSLYSSDIKLILGDELLNFRLLYKKNSKSSEIIDENKIIKELAIKNQDVFSLDNEFLHIKRLYITNCYLKLTLNCYSNLKFLCLKNAKGNFNNINFLRLKDLDLIIIDKLECKFNNCNFDSVLNLKFELDINAKVKEIHINSIFKNLNKLTVFSFSNSLKRLNLNISSENPIIKKVKLPKTIELSGSLVQRLHGDIKNNYNIILPKGKNPYNIY